MNKFDVAGDDVIDLFNEVKNETTIPEYITFDVRTNEKQKCICDITKASELWEKVSGVNFVVTVNERAFDLIDEDNQKLVFEELLSGINVTEKGVSTEKPDFCTYTGMLNKYGHESIVRMKEVEISAFDQIKEEDDAKKAQTSKSRKKNY